MTTCRGISAPDWNGTAVGTGLPDVLWVPNTREATPADVGSIGEMVKQVLGPRNLVQQTRTSDSGPQGGGNTRHGSEWNPALGVFKLPRSFPGLTAFLSASNRVSMPDDAVGLWGVDGREGWKGGRVLWKDGRKDGSTLPERPALSAALVRNRRGLCPGLELGVRAAWAPGVWHCCGVGSGKRGRVKAALLLRYSTRVK